MKSIPNIKLTIEEFVNLKRTPYFNYGSEADIYHTGNPNTLYKIFSDPKGMSDNKLQKIAKLYQHPLSYSVRPLSTISYAQTLIGYEMTYDREDQEFRTFKKRLSRSEIIYWLEETKKILEYYKSQDVIYSDVASRNILINPRTKQAKFCDIDNISLGENPYDVLPDFLEFYSTLCPIDEKTPAYAHSIMTLNAFGLNENSTFQELITNFSKESRYLLEEIRNPQTYNGEYIIKYIKKRR
ncbi:MAG: hypothetical protein PUC82_00065 [bacterium]|nr:hypothetical protein [bacterium]